MLDSVLNTSLFAGIEIADPDLVQSMFIERRYSKGQVLFWQGDPGLHMYIIQSGSLKIFRQAEGKELILGHQFPGETIGELEAVHNSNLRLASAATLEKTVLWAIHKPDLENLILLYPQVLRNLFYVIGERLGQADRKLEYLAFLGTRIRVANLLLDLYSNFGVEAPGGYKIDWKITHQHLAYMIGAGRESVTIALQELQANQIIAVHNKYITVTNLTALKQLANDEQDFFADSREWHPSSKYNIRQ